MEKKAEREKGGEEQVYSGITLATFLPSFEVEIGHCISVHETGTMVTAPASPSEIPLASAMSPGLKLRVSIALQKGVCSELSNPQNCFPGHQQAWLSLCKDRISRGRAFAAHSFFAETGPAAPPVHRHPGISLTSLASDNIVVSVESLNEEENNRPPPIMSSTSQAAWKSLASTSLVLEPPTLLPTSAPNRVLAKSSG